MSRSITRRFPVLAVTLLAVFLLSLIGSPVANAGVGDQHDKGHGKHHLTPPKGKGAFAPVPELTGLFIDTGISVCGSTATFASTAAVQGRTTTKRNGDVITELRGPWIVDIKAAGFEPANGLDISGFTVYVDHPNGTSTYYFYGPAVVEPRTGAEESIFTRAGLPREGFYFTRGLLVAEADTESGDITRIRQAPKSRYVDALCGDVLVPEQG